MPRRLEHGVLLSEARRFECPSIRDACRSAGERKNRDIFGSEFIAGPRRPGAVGCGRAAPLGFAIFVDYLRNSQGATAIAPYGIRARRNAPVSTPIAWGELAQDLRFDYFNVNTIPDRLSRLRQDPWQDFAATRQAVTASMFKQVGIKAGVNGY